MSDIVTKAQKIIEALMQEHTADIPKDPIRQLITIMKEHGYTPTVWFMRREVFDYLKKDASSLFPNEIVFLTAYWNIPIEIHPYWALKLYDRKADVYIEFWTTDKWILYGQNQPVISGEFK